MLRLDPELKLRIDALFAEINKPGNATSIPMEVFVEFVKLRRDLVQEFDLSFDAEFEILRLGINRANGGLVPYSPLQLAEHNYSEISKADQHDKLKVLHAAATEHISNNSALPSSAGKLLSMALPCNSREDLDFGAEVLEAFSRLALGFYQQD